MHAYIYHSQNRIVIFTINLSCSLQMSEPVNLIMDTFNCQDGMIMWRKVGWEGGKDCHIVLLHIVMNCAYLSESEINCQSLWQFLFYRYPINNCQHKHSLVPRGYPMIWLPVLLSLIGASLSEPHTIALLHCGRVWTFGCLLACACGHIP